MLRNLGKERNYPTDMETLLEKDFSHFLTGSYALDMKNCL